MSNFLNMVKTPPSSKEGGLIKEEILALLTLIKRSHFLGEDVEKIYNLTLKLQNQYNSKE